MRQCLPAVMCSFAIAAAGLSCAAGANAEPESDGPEQPSCNYTLSEPRVVDVSGRPMVMATLKPYPCTGSINPNSLTVCVSAQGDPSAGECGFSAVPDQAEVYAPYKPGTTYVTRGTGCASVYTTQGSICSTVGPVTTTL